MTYEQLARFAQQGGTVYFVLIFVAGCAYAFWPKKKGEFQHAARIPLEENDNEPA
jgi:cytochrome c oxidase cbb3-type subunit 4